MFNTTISDSIGKSYDISKKYPGHFLSQNIYVSAYLALSGHKLTDTVKEEERGRLWFVFDDEEACKKASIRFWAREGDVDARSYACAVKSIIRMIFK